MLLTCAKPCRQPLNLGLVIAFADGLEAWHVCRTGIGTALLLKQTLSQPLSLERAGPCRAPRSADQGQRSQRPMLRLRHEAPSVGHGGLASSSAVLSDAASSSSDNRCAGKREGGGREQTMTPAGAGEPRKGYFRHTERAGSCTAGCRHQCSVGQRRARLCRH